MRIFILFFIVFGAIEITAQDPSYWQITDEDGLPSMTVYKILQDQKGYMWIGTAAGVCRYDGKEFEHFRHEEQIDDEIIHLEIDSFGRIWYSNLAGQLFYINEDGVIKNLEEFSNSSLVLSDIDFRDTLMVISCRDKNVKGQQRDGFLMFSIKEEPYKLINKIKFEYYSNSSVFLNDIFFGSGVINNSKSYLTKIDLNGSEVQMDDLLNESIDGALKGFPNLNKFDSARICFSNNAYIVIYDFVENEIKNSQQIKFSKGINSVFIDDGICYLLTRGEGIVSYDPLKNFLSKPFLNNITFNSAVCDREGVFWFATNDRGIILLQKNGLSFFTTQNSNLASNSVLSLISNSDKELFCGHENGTLSIVKKNTINKFIELKDITRVTGILSDLNGSLYVVSDENMVVIDSSKNLHYKGFKGLSAKSILKSSSGDLWIGNYRASIKIPKEKIQFFSFDHTTSKHHFLDIRTYPIFSDFQDDIWLGTAKGLYRELNEQPTPFLDNDGNHSLYLYSSITQSPYDSSIWAATQGDGILMIKNDTIAEHFTVDNKLVSNACKDVFADEFGNVWVATNMGIQKFNLNTKKTELINRYDGLPTNETLKVIVVDSTVYVGTNKGLITFPIDIKTKNTVSPPILISNISILESDTSVLERYDLKQTQNSLQVDFVGLGYKAQGDIKYKYRMLGIDTNWVETDTRFARFPALRPGNYEFQVVALNEDRVESVEPAVVKFNISPPYWETWWFRTLAGLGVVVSIGLIFNARFQRIRRREKREQEFKEQVDELRGQALQTQMNPHFIFNSLSAIQHFLTMNDEESAMLYLAKFAKLIRHIFDQSKEKTITLAEELKFLKLYVSLEELRFNDKVTAEFVVDENSEEYADEIEFPPLLIQPIIENSFKHGLFHKQSAGKLLIQFSFENEMLKCLVEDNGVGRTRSAEINKWKKGTHKSSGLNSTRERIHLLNSESTSNPNKLKITDLFDSVGKPIGTRVEIFLKPKKYA